MTRIELLRHEDELHRAPITASTSLRYASAKSLDALVPPRVCRTCSTTEPDSKVLVLEHTQQSLDERIGITARNQEGIDAVGCHVRDPAAVRADDHPAARERLEHDPPEALRVRRKDERPRGIDLSRDAVGRKLDEVLDLGRKVRGQPLDHLVSRALSDDGEHRIRLLRGDASPGGREPVHVLVRLEGAHEHNAEGVRDRDQR